MKFRRKFSWEERKRERGGGVVERKEKRQKGRGDGTRKKGRKKDRWRYDGGSENMKADFM